MYGICGLFFGIGVLTLLIGLWYFAIAFISAAIFIFVKSKKDINKITEELKAKGVDVTIDSFEEKEQLKKEVVGEFKNNFTDVTSKTFTKNNFKWILKIFIPIYCVITIIVTLLLGFFINIFLGIFVFMILIVSGIIYYFIISIIFKHYN